MPDRGQIWVVVLIKDFATAKQRLAPRLDAETRSALARENAERALEAARAGDRVLAVTCGPDAVDWARGKAKDVLMDGCKGQNAAAQAGIDRALGGGATAVLLLSSDLPLVSRAAVSGMLAAASGQTPEVITAPAHARGGTNALYLAPPDCLELQFGDGSLARFEREAARLGIPFSRYDSPVLALDVDEPADLRALDAVASR